MDNSKSTEVMVSLTKAREKISQFSKTLYHYDSAQVKAALKNLFSPQAKIQLAYPFETLNDVDDFYIRAYRSLEKAIPNLERREYLFIAGVTEAGNIWVGSAGYYTGTFANAWLDIPPTGDQVSMRYHEFFMVEGEKVVEFQGLWDIPEVMMQAGVWPMTPSLGREWLIPSPATQDGIRSCAQMPHLIEDLSQSRASVQLINDMLTGLSKHATEGVEGMRLEDYWHPKCSWYGPAGIGTCRGITGFRNWHQIPFLNAMPNRVGGVTGGAINEPHFFGDGDYVGFTAWPGMQMILSNDGWLGIAPANQEITMRSLDFWRIEQTPKDLGLDFTSPSTQRPLIRENWVLIDILHVYQQLGVDVFGRMKEFNKHFNIESLFS